jgi:glutamate racemase
VDERPIGVFDSGFGGISVLAEATRILPSEDFLFLGDNRNTPYGDKTPGEVLAFTRGAVEKLVALGCKAILIACNTATSAAAETLRGELTQPIIGMEPALKPAALLPGIGAVLVMATAMTLKLDKFHTLMARYGQNAIPVPCPGLVEMIEAGETSGPRVATKLNELLTPYLDRPVKAVVLGCTHYVFLKPALRAFLPLNVMLVDGNEGTARQLQNRLTQKGLLKTANGSRPNARGNIEFITTAEDPAIPARMRAWYNRFVETLDSACISTPDTVE